MRNILLVTDNFTGGGLETRIIEQIKILKNYKIHFFLVCRNFNPVYSKYFTAISSDLLSGRNPDVISTDEILKDVDTVCHFCKKYDIDFIDSHPFWCILPTTIAANKLQIPASFTIHGVASGDIIKDEYLTAKALYHLSMSYGFTQIFTVAEYLTNLYSYLPEPKIIRNGFILNKRPTKTLKNTHKIAIVSRLDAPKSKIILDFLPEVYSCNTINQIDIIGDGDHIDDVKNFITQNQLSDKVNVIGWAENIAEAIDNNYMIIFGMGRVILDSIKSNTPAGVLGYGGFAGIVNRHNLMDFSKTNLTSWEKSTEPLSQEINTILKNPSNYFFNNSELALFDATLIWQEYLTMIKDLKYHNRPEIEKLYTIISENPTTNLMNNEHIFLECIRLLSDGDKPINPHFFYIVFQKQFDEIHKLQNDLKLASSSPKLLNNLPRKIFRHHNPNKTKN